MRHTHPYYSITLVNPAKGHPQWTLLTLSIEILYFKLSPTGTNWNHLLCQAQDSRLKCILSHSNTGITARERRLLASIVTFKAEDDVNLLEITLCWVLHKYSHYSPYPRVNSRRQDKTGGWDQPPFLGWARQNNKNKQDIHYFLALGQGGMKSNSYKSRQLEF